MNAIVTYGTSRADHPGRVTVRIKGSPRHWWVQYEDVTVAWRAAFALTGKLERCESSDDEERVIAAWYGSDN